MKISSGSKDYINIKTDKSIIKVEVADYGACKSQTFTVSGLTDINLNNNENYRQKKTYRTTTSLFLSLKLS